MLLIKPMIWMPMTLIVMNSTQTSALYCESVHEWLRRATMSQSKMEITSDSNIIPYSQYLSEAQQETIQNSNSSAQQDVLILSMFEQLTTQVTHCTNVNQALTTELDRYKEEVKDLKEMQNVENSFSGSNEQYAEIERCSLDRIYWKFLRSDFTIVGNACPLTRITTTNEVPSRKLIVIDSESPKPVVKLVYSRKPRKNKNTVSISKAKVVKNRSSGKSSKKPQPKSGRYQSEKTYLLHHGSMWDNAFLSSGLVPTPSSTPFVPPFEDLTWDLLFQPMFDESLNPPPYVDLQTLEVIAPIPEVVAPEHAVSTGSPSSTIVDQDAPSSRLQISQSPRGIFINQSKYALESLKKYGFESCDPVDTPMVEKGRGEEAKVRDKCDERGLGEVMEERGRKGGGGGSRRGGKVKRKGGGGGRGRQERREDVEHKRLSASKQCWDGGAREKEEGLVERDEESRGGGSKLEGGRREEGGGSGVELGGGEGPGEMTQDRIIID
ncbi:hypothetical protein Tco_0565484 [Tanacetum coccineum]